MIQTITIIECDSCWIRFEALDDQVMGPDEIIEWAKNHGWWAEYHSIRQYCPNCKVSAKLALAKGVTP